MRLIPHILKDDYYAVDCAVLHIALRWLSGHILENGLQCCRLTLYHQARNECMCVHVKMLR